MTIDTGFDVHVDFQVQSDRDVPHVDMDDVYRRLAVVAQGHGKILSELETKWFDVTGLGYSSDWICAIGAKYIDPSHASAQPESHPAC